MADLKMKKLRLLVLRARRDELLHELIRLGCVEFSRIDGKIKGSELEPLLKPEDRSREALEEKLKELEQAITLLEKHSSAAVRRRMKKLEQEDSVLLDDTGLGLALRTSQRLLELEERLGFLETEQKRLQALVEQLQPWLGLDVPLSLGSSENCSLLVGHLPLNIDPEKLEAELTELDERCELFSIKEDKKLRYAALLCMREQAEAMESRLKAKGFVRAPATDGPGTAIQCSSEAKEKLQQYAREEKHARELIAQDVIHWEELRLAAERMNVKTALAGAEECFYGTESCLLMEGWLPEGREAELSAVFERLGCAYDISQPLPEDKAEMPVRIDDGKWHFGKKRPFRPLEIKTKYYRLAE